uniref:Uncharacterized protein n=1 Tax=Acrobeloides nanus TaxID=290746 RepID=A0A914DJG2_9BILA
MTSQKKQIALEAREFMSPLIATKFFIIYPGFIKKHDEIDSEINFLIHNTKKYLMRALKKYFNSLFEGKDLKFIEKPKQADVYR